MKRLLILLLMISGFVFARGQIPNACSYIIPKEGDNWCFFENDLLSFAGGTPGVDHAPQPAQGGLCGPSKSSKAAERSAPVHQPGYRRASVIADGVGPFWQGLCGPFTPESGSAPSSRTPKARASTEREDPAAHRSNTTSST